MKKKLLIVCGAPKSGTTSLYNELNKLDSFSCSKVKEPQFWCSDLDLNLYSNKIKKFLDSNHIQKTTDYNDYLNLFKNKNKILVDCSNSYLFSKNAFLNASKIFNIEVIIIVRHPVQRAISHFKMLMRLGIVSDPFNELNVAIDASQTWGQTTDWYTCSFYEKYIPDVQNNYKCTIIDFDKIINDEFDLTIFNKKYTLNLSEQKNSDFTIRFKSINKFCFKYFYKLRKLKILKQFYKKIIISEKQKKYDWEHLFEKKLEEKLKISINYYNHLKASQID